MSNAEFDRSLTLAEIPNGVTMIPDFQTIMLPLLKLLADGKDCSLHDAHGRLVDHFALSQDEVNELLPSGRQKTFYNGDRFLIAQTVSLSGLSSKY